MTLKPTQCALCLKPRILANQKMCFLRAFDRIYNPIEESYVRFMDGLVHHSRKVSLFGIFLICLAVLGLTRVPTVLSYGGSGIRDYERATT